MLGLSEVIAEGYFFSVSNHVKKKGEHLDSPNERGSLFFVGAREKPDRVVAFAPKPFCLLTQLSIALFVLLNLASLKQNVRVDVEPSQHTQ